MYAIKNKNSNNIARLINAGADVNAVDINGRTSFCYAVIYCNDQDVVNLLINKGADSKTSNVFDRIWFRIEVVKKSDDKFMAKLISYTKHISYRNKDKIIRDVYGQTFLMYAIKLNMNKNIIFNAIHNVDNVNATDNKGNSALIYAIKYKCDIDIIIKLIEHGADINVIGADVNICDNKVLTPIMYAILYGKKHITLEIISTLIQSGAHIDAIDKDGRTALCYALSKKGFYDEEIAVLLLDNEASVHNYLANLSEKKNLYFIL
ncbi:uncharacterized protein LOC142327831 [Lycorma delicatula]|uniref:uncharacterized protein LOC142327831 n=1 Tax=Lycorma delicatula TaxID=130591 RepID=UPI003F514580